MDVVPGLTYTGVDLCKISRAGKNGWLNKSVRHAVNIYCAVRTTLSSSMLAQCRGMHYLTTFTLCYWTA